MVSYPEVKKGKPNGLKCGECGWPLVDTGREVYSDPAEAETECQKCGKRGDRPLGEEIKTVTPKQVLERCLATLEEAEELLYELSRHHAESERVSRTIAALRREHVLLPHYHLGGKQ